LVWIESDGELRFVERSQGNPHGAGGVKRVDDMEIMGEGLRKVLPGMARGVDADEAVARIGALALVVIFQCGGVIRSLVAEELAKGVRLAAVPNEEVPIIVADLVTKVTEHRAIRLGHGVAMPLAGRVIALLHRYGDDPVAVAHDGLRSGI